MADDRGSGTSVLLLDKNGIIMPEPARRFFCIVDGIVEVGEGRCASDCSRGLRLSSGMKPIAVDMVATRLMGFDVGRIQ